jgi:hypothetical protein
MRTDEDFGIQPVPPEDFVSRLRPAIEEPVQEPVNRRDLLRGVFLGGKV